MIEIARLPADDRRELFHNTAAKTGLHDAIVEKDFWVCLTLDYLFHRSPWKKAVTFKGGTSLSKGYHLISRFSEDIDLILDWRVLGYGINEPWEKRSNTKQDAFNKEANRKAEIFLAETFCPQVREGLSVELGLPANLSGGYCTVCRGAVPAVIQAERGFCPDGGAGADFLGKSYDPSP